MPAAPIPDVRRLLEPASIAVIGASERPGSFGERLTAEALRSTGARVHLVHPKYAEVMGRPCVPTLADVDDTVDLVVLGVPDAVLAGQLELAGEHGAGGAVIFGSAYGLAPDLRAAAKRAGLALCGGGCMGFVNPAKGIRAIGYNEREQLGPGPVALITHSGSVFSAMLRTHRELHYSLAVSAGQELVTNASDYLQYAVDLPETKVVGMFLETLRDADGMRRGLAIAAERDIAVVALTVGDSATGREMVTAHSGALAGADGAWEALFERYGVHRVTDLDEFTDTLELFAIGRRIPRRADRPMIATVHDSGGERALIADAAEAVDVAFAPLTDDSRDRLTEIIDEGLAATNPLDVWGTGADTETLFTSCLRVLAQDETVDAVALAVDLIVEYDGDIAYPDSVETVAAETTKPLVVLSNSSSALDQVQAQRLRALGVPVLEGTYSGLRALRHLIDHATERPRSGEPVVKGARRAHWRSALASGDLDPTRSGDLLADYGIDVARTLSVSTSEGAVKAAADVGYPVVLKTAVAGIEHKADVDGVRLGLQSPEDVTTTYADLAHRLGPEVTVQPQLSGDVELALGILNDPVLGPLVLLAVGGTLVEVIQQRRVALPPLSTEQADAMISRLPVVETLLGGVRGRPAADRDAVVRALVGLSELAAELGDLLAAVDVNPLLCSAQRAVAVDALIQRREG